MEIKCQNCGLDYEVTPDHAGMEFECSECKTPITVSEDLFTAESAPTSPPPASAVQEIPDTSESDPGRCPKCGATLKPKAKICIECGHNLKLGMNIKTVAKAKKAGSFSLAVGIAAGTAVVSALIWAGIAIAITMEIGWVAWGIGVAVGGSVIMMTDERSARLAIVAVILAVCSIFLGKLIYVSYGLDDTIKAGIKNTPEALTDLLILDMIQKNEIDENYLEWIQTNGIDNQEALKKENKKTQELIRKEKDKFDEKLAALTPEDKERLYTLGTNQVVASISYMDRLRATTSFWDILWILLAISSAWKIASGQTAEE